MLIKEPTTAGHPARVPSRNAALANRRVQEMEPALLFPNGFFGELKKTQPVKPVPTPQLSVKARVAEKPVVMKFGGSSLGNAEAVHRSCQIIYDAFQKGQKPVVIVSALYGVTNMLGDACNAARSGDAAKVAEIRHELRDFHLQQAEDIFYGNKRFSVRFRVTLDRILAEYFDPNVAKIAEHKDFKENWFEVVSSLGERLSVPLVCACLSFQGCDVAEVYTDKLILLDEKDILSCNGVQLDETNTRLRKRILPMLESGVTPIISGYIAGDNRGTTTLGRGGSDLSSTLVAGAIGASSVHLWKVESVSTKSGQMVSWAKLPEQQKWTGLRSVDPSVVQGSLIVERLSYAEASELAHYGKKVLHRATMEPVQAKDISVNIRNTALPNHPGTAVGPAGDLARKPSKSDANIIVNISLAKYKDLHIKNKSLGAAIAQIESSLPAGAEPTLVAVLGSNIMQRDGLLARVKTQLLAHGVSPLSVDDNVMTKIGSQHSIAVLLQAADVPLALNALHAGFVEEAVVSRDFTDDGFFAALFHEDMVWPAGIAYPDIAVPQATDTPP